MARRGTTAGLIIARRHPAGHLEAQAVPGSGRRGQVLARFLQSDVRSDIDAARTLLAAVAAAERGEATQPAAVGNAYRVALSSEGITVGNAVNEGSRAQAYGFDEMRRALGLWIAAIQRAGRNPI
jgi:hypothetical protein